MWPRVMATPCFSVCPSSLSLPSWRETGLFLVSKWQDVQLLLWAFAWMVPFDIDSSPWLSRKILRVPVELSLRGHHFPSTRLGQALCFHRPRHSHRGCAYVSFGNNLPATHQHLPPDYGLLALLLTPPQSTRDSMPSFKCL